LGRLSPALRQVAHVLRTRSPVALASPRDLHVLSTPPAFVLSQDQTLQEFDIARSSNRCHHAVAHDSVSESLNCSVQALPNVPNGRQFNELASHIQIPNRLSKSSLSLSATAFNCTSFTTARQPRKAAIATKQRRLPPPAPTPASLSNIKPVNNLASIASNDRPGGIEQ
jgi:hypothetical protein